MISPATTDCHCRPSEPDPCEHEASLLTDCEPCDLDCLLRPVFFRGQLLQDQDLQALVDWAGDRIALQRYRSGWGAVCGLHVSTHPTRRDHLRVSRGYGVSACGHDVLLPCETDVPLAGLCPPVVDPCATGKPADDGANDGDDRKGCLPDARGLRVVDVYLRHAERPTSPTPAVVRSDCGAPADCQYARALECGKVVAVPHSGSADDDPARKAWKRWLELYAECFTRFDRILGEFEDSHVFTGSRSKEATGGRAEDLPRIKQALWSWMDSTGVGGFGFVRDCLCAIDEAKPKREVAEILFYLLLACRSEFFARWCGCAVGNPCPGVPLARAWLELVPGNGCKVVYVDTHPPYRRPLSVEEPPAPPGQRNLGCFVWSRVEDLCRIARAVGLDRIRKHAKSPLPPPDSLDDLKQVRALLEDEALSAGCDDELYVLTVETPLMGERVIAFSKASGQ